jgi:hypothetical protein
VHLLDRPLFFGLGSRWKSGSCGGAVPRHALRSSARSVPPPERSRRATWSRGGHGGHGRGRGRRRNDEKMGRKYGKIMILLGKARRNYLFKWNFEVYNGLQWEVEDVKLIFYGLNWLLSLLSQRTGLTKRLQFTHAPGNYGKHPEPYFSCFTGFSRPFHVYHNKY